MKKRCPRCRKLKEAGEFHNNSSRKDGLADACKKCELKRVRKYYGKPGQPVKRRYKYEQTHRKVGRVKQKRCRKCMKWRPESEYYKHRHNKDGLDAWCKKCVSKSQRGRGY
ncbi:MAG: hypothetical protein ACYSSO_04535 [Planctomycetota bacterium]